MKNNIYRYKKILHIKYFVKIRMIYQIKDKAASISIITWQGIF